MEKKAKNCSIASYSNKHYLFIALILNHIISMKKMNSDSNRSYFNNREEYLSPTRFPKKQFQLLYREKEHLPSSGAYESIIFVKSKKYQKKGVQSHSKMPSKVKKSQGQNLNKVINKIEKQFRQQQSNRKRREEELLKSAILKNNVNNTFHTKKQSIDQSKSPLAKKINKYQRPQSGTCQNAKKYRNVVSPSKRIKAKLSQQATASTQFIKTTTQETFRKAPSNKDQKRKENQDPFSNLLSFSQPEEYIFLDDNFLALGPKDLSAVEGKLLSNRDIYYGNKFSYNQHQPQAEELMPQYSETDKIFQQYLEYHDSSQLSQANSFHSDSSGRKSFAQNKLAIVHNYLVSKVILIQTWWRTMMKKKAYKAVQPLVGEQKQQHPFVITTEKSIQFGEELVSNEVIINSSPIKMIDQLCNPFEDQTCQLKAIVLREKAARAQKQAHQKILEKLLLSKKITSQIYIDKNEAIQAKYYSQLHEIQQIKRMLNSNAIKAVEIEKKTIQDLNLIESDDVVVDSNLLDKIFGIEQPTHSQINNILTGMPVLHNDSLQRQKSTGCHFHSEEPYSSSLYRKDRVEEEYQEDFEEYGQEGSSQQAECKDQFFQERIKVDESDNNLKQLFDEFNLREQVKAEIDKRAAIQMGIISVSVPAELKDEFVSIDTSLSSIHCFILSFFKYYIFYYKLDFLRLINMPYGYNIDKRIKFLQGNISNQCSEEDEDGVIYGLESVIPEDIFEQFYEKVFDTGQQKISSAKLANFQFEKIHNRAIFDCFNESLNFFRPYFLINGPPFPWAFSEKALTFYFIAEENIQEVFDKTQFKVLKWASTLCGIIVDKYFKPTPQIPENQSAEKIVSFYQQSTHPLINETRQDRLAKNQKLQIEEHNYQWENFENQKTTNNMETASKIFEDLIDEVCLEILMSRDKLDEAQPQFFQVMEENSSFSDAQIC